MDTQHVAPEWKEGKQGAAVTIFFQGMLASQTQLAKYCGIKGFTATTGEHVSIGERGIEVIHTPFIGKELDEVVPRPVNDQKVCLLTCDALKRAVQPWWWLESMFAKAGQLASALGHRYYGIDVRTGSASAAASAEPPAPAPALEQKSEKKSEHTETRAHGDGETNEPPLRIESAAQRDGAPCSLTQSLFSQSYETAQSISSHSVRVSWLNLAQDRDVAEHKMKHDLLMKTSQHGSSLPLVLFGCSRGSATTFNAYATHQYANVKLVVLEGCYFSVQDAMAHRFPRTQAWTAWALERTTSWRPDGPSPERLVDRFPQITPIAFLSSVKDTEVPLHTTQNLVRAMVKRGQNPVYFLVLKHSTHSFYPIGADEDRLAYLHFLHALYKSLELPHVPAWAERGVALLESCHVRDLDHPSLRPV